MNVLVYALVGLVVLGATTWLYNEISYQRRVWGKQYSAIVREATQETCVYLQTKGPIKNQKEHAQLLRRIMRRWRVAEDLAAHIISEARPKKKLF
jgi:hypothetical protein